ncbi:hypothetical protein EV363DRAFT_1394838 [Boletus edulis]|nr:hypothetical protein EV363DRAFT_1394838 [Boletus edulis]
MFSSIFDNESPSDVHSSLEYVINHIFPPFKFYHPKQDDYTQKNAHALACVVHAATCAYHEHIDDVHKHHWLHITKMLENLQVFIAPTQPCQLGVKDMKFDISQQVGGMKAGDVLVFPTPDYVTTSGVIFRKHDNFTLYETVNAVRDLVKSKKLICSHPELAIMIPNVVFDDQGFRSELADLLSGTSEELLTSRLHRAGRPVKPRRITKHPSLVSIFRDTHGRKGDDLLPMRSRSELWFIIRVAIQSSLDLSPPCHGVYKAFVLFLMYNIANHAININSSLPSFLIHSMSAKILRRFRKLFSVTQWLQDAVFDTCTNLSQTLDQRWQGMQAAQRSSSPLDPFQLDLVKDIQPSLSHIHGYISDSLTNHDSNSSPSRMPFFPNHRPRGSLNDFLSDPDDFLSNFVDTFPTGVSQIQADIHIALYDVEWAVTEDIDEWLACVTDVEKACEQLEHLIYRYQLAALDIYHGVGGFGRLPTDPDHLSIMLLTIIELWVALDKLVIKEIPILADYSPEVPINLLCRVLLHDTVSIHRFRRVFQYIFARHTLAHPGWSVFSNEITEHSFPCRYYDSAPHLQHLKARIEGQLPADPIHAKVVVFELQCPMYLNTWYYVTHRISGIKGGLVTIDISDILVRNIPALNPHANVLAGRSRPLSLYTSRIAPWSRLHYKHPGSSSLECSQPIYELPSGPYKDSGMQQYLSDTMHTSNEGLAAQANSHYEVSLHEFVAFTQLRSGGSLQWFNILRELRSRTLDFRRQEVYLLLAQASAQVGPLDGTGQLLWHQELQDASFCHTLLNELQSLFIDIGVGSSDGPAMATISLLACLLTSRSSRHIAEQALQLLRDVRRKTFVWVHELLYDVRKSPTIGENIGLLRDMAAVCRSSFNVGCATSHELFQSVQDVEIVLSCAMLICTIGPPASSDASTYSQVLLDRDCRLSVILEGSLRDAIKADASDIGVDRAIQTVWPGYRPSPCRWKPLDSPNSRWLVCESAPTRDRHSQTVHVNLLNGTLLVDGRPIGNKLPSIVTQNEVYITLFGSRELTVVPSDLPGMDFVAMSDISGHRVHFAVREDRDRRFGLGGSRIVICAQSNETGDIFEHIPWGILARDLPTSVIAQHFSWFNLSTSTIEIRPMAKLWERSSDNWTIRLQPGQSRVTKGEETLVDKQSPTWAMVSRRLQCLDDPENLIITVSPVGITQFLSPRLSVTLCRYGLSFFINEANNLESDDFKDMVYDEDQCIGTLFGLANRLVLRPKTLIEADLIPKLIVIPHNDSIDQHTHKIYVKNNDSSGPVRYYIYQADRELGCLKGIVSFPVESRLYLARLHALTSGWRPDPLTSRTGTEEAASLLWLGGGQVIGQHWCSGSQSPQIRFASAHRTTKQPEELLRQEAYLFPPSEVTVAAGVRCRGMQSLDQLLLERLPPSLPRRVDRLPPSHYNLGRHSLSLSPSNDLLRQLFSSLQINQTAPPFQSQYISRLHNSAHHLQTVDPIGVTCRRDNRKPGTETLRNYYAQCRINYMESLDMVKVALGPKTDFERILEQCGQWPRVTPFVLFRCLASTPPIKLSKGWKKCLISLGLLALDVQWARRLLRFALDNLEEEFYSELGNEGCDERDLANHPDWLLIQLQGNFRIRPVQAEIVKEMMSPRSGKNTVTQVNMGEGKSSVIIPICAVALADGNQLVRIIVPKALIPQTLQLLTDRLCGLVNKPIYLLTFTRDEVNSRVHHQSTELDIQGEFKHLHAKRILQWRDERAIIVMQPEAVLSLKLANVENQLLENGVGINTAPSIPKQGFENVLHVQMDWSSESVRELMEIQRVLETHARDILDESDDVLRPQFQLIYATGHQHPFEGSPGRWVIVQQILGLVKRHAYLLSTLDSRTIRCDGSSLGQFPHIHILQAEGGERLVSLIAQDVLDGRLLSLSFHSGLGLRETIREFMLCKDIHPDTVKMVERYARQSTNWASLLLLRGLLAHNVLLFVLTQRRWRVDYGLDLASPPRTMFAIPYRAKDVPTKTAEFGHPDITILLTCLSYYYGGLSNEQLRISFELLLQEDDPSSEYALWLGDCGTAPVPNPLRKLSGVNIRSLEQWDNYLVPLFSRNKRTVDLYLSKVVFAKHAKEFSLRISGSYWDIAERKNYLVTGLSGTNDGQYLLPTSIHQVDPDHIHQTGTNARVLAYLLQPENSSYMVTTNEDGERWTTRKLLGMIVAQDPKIRVLLDVGAQILDLNNRQLAKAWLYYTPATEVAGAIYFNEEDELMVLERNGNTRPLSSSPLVQQLHRCVAYLDDAHTRGTDIKFPLDFRAAVTLGHKVTKDRLVQGCMRMRKLGHGHSVMFFAPHEVDQRIRGLVAKDSSPTIRVTTADILHWAIHETWNDIQRQAPYWAHHGMSHQSRREAWSRFCGNRATAKELAEAWVQPELKSLADMYMPSHSRDTSFTRLPRQIRERCEMEVSREIEREREVERPLEVVSPATQCLHPDVIQFVRTGIIPSPSWSEAFCHVLATDATATSSELHAWSPHILATTDFCKTIQESESVQGAVNHYLRPVQWVMSGKMHGRDALVLLSPFEVDWLMPEIRISEHVHLHLYIPRTSKRMKPADDLRLYSVPPLPSYWTPPWDLIDQLNVFAGQLFLTDYTSYVRLCRFLGVHAGDLPQNAGTVVLRNWLSNPYSESSDTKIKNRLKGTPLPHAMHLLAVRRGKDFARTHMGRILDGWPLSEEDFEGSESRITEIAGE